MSLGWCRFGWGECENPPATPLESLKLLTGGLVSGGLTPSLLLLGDSLEPDVGTGPWTNVGAAINQPALGSGNSLLATAQFNFAQNTAQQVLAPDITTGDVGDLQTGEHVAIVFTFRQPVTTGGAILSITGKRDAAGLNSGWEVTVNGGDMLAVTVDTGAPQAAIATTYTVADDKHYVGVLHFNVTDQLIELATHRRLSGTGVFTAPMPTGSATNSIAMSGGKGRLSALGSSMLALMEFRGPQLVGLNAHELALALYGGIDPQDPDGSWGMVGRLLSGQGAD